MFLPISFLLEDNQESRIASANKFIVQKSLRVRAKTFSSQGPWRLILSGLKPHRQRRDGEFSR